MDHPPQFSVGFVLMPNFTMLAFAAFVDTLRLAGDEGDRSRPIDCRWTVMTEDGGSACASNGIRVVPDSALGNDPAQFDYLVVVGGTLRHDLELGATLSAYLARAVAARTPLIGVCTGSFILARAGLMSGRKCCVSWFHKAEMEAEFPDLDVVGDQLFVVDRDRITCAGGTSVIHLASFLVEQHVGKGRSDKGLRIMLEERLRGAGSAQPLPLIDTTVPPMPDVGSSTRVPAETGGGVATRLAASIAAARHAVRRAIRRRGGLLPSAFVARTTAPRSNSRNTGPPRDWARSDANGSS